MKKPFSTKRLLAIALGGAFAGAIGIIGIYLHGLASTQEPLFGREHQHRFCGRCGYQEWSTVTGALGFQSFRHDPFIAQKKDFAGIDQSTCQHLFFTVGVNETMFTIPDFRMNRFTYGCLTNDPFFEKPILVQACRTLEQENNQQDAINLFYHLVSSAKFRSRLSTNLVEALKGTNSQALVHAIYQSFADSGQKLHPAKGK
jgi:hypothetical protein